MSLDDRDTLNTSIGMRQLLLIKAKLNRYIEFYTLIDNNYAQKAADQELIRQISILEKEEKDWFKKTSAEKNTILGNENYKKKIEEFSSKKQDFVNQFNQAKKSKDKSKQSSILKLINELNNELLQSDVYNIHKPDILMSRIQARNQAIHTEITTHAIEKADTLISILKKTKKTDPDREVDNTISALKQNIYNLKHKNDDLDTMLENIEAIIKQEKIIKKSTKSVHWDNSTTTISTKLKDTSSPHITINPIDATDNNVVDSPVYFDSLVDRPQDQITDIDELLQNIENESNVLDSGIYLSKDNPNYDSLVDRPQDQITDIDQLLAEDHIPNEPQPSTTPLTTQSAHLPIITITTTEPNPIPVSTNNTTRPRSYSEGTQSRNAAHQGTPITNEPRIFEYNYKKPESYNLKKNLLEHDRNRHVEVKHIITNNNNVTQSTLSADNYELTKLSQRKLTQAAIEWVEKAVGIHTATNPGAKFTITIEGNLAQEKFLKQVALYCDYKEYQVTWGHLNFKDYIDKHKDEFSKHFEKLTSNNQNVRKPSR